MNKILEQNLLYDFYGELLTDRQKDVFEQHILDDLSLKEIADETGVSRQGVHDSIKRSIQTLLDYEEKLHLVEKFLAIKEELVKMTSLVDTLEKNEKTEEMKHILDRILREL
ncbi:MAG TPA: YlxM family DNA-binding protein [Candidatus Dorea intestinavium]|nr:YlxM family DNA-binding protein [Candidatus Dorea intestinavium]